MADAEDVLVAAAERLTHAARRARATRREPGHYASDPASALLRLERWLVACFGRSWPLVLVDRPAPVGWLRRALDRPAPWQVDPPPVAGTDGACLLLPRSALGSESTRLAALALGRRLVLGRHGGSEVDPLCRDIGWALEAAEGEVALAALLPGLAASFERARADALAVRPRLDSLRGGERVVEELVRSLLRAPERAAGHDVAGSAGRSDAEYRGVAPVAHWGVLLDGDVRVPASARPGCRDEDPKGRPAMRRLTRQLRRRPADEAASRPGPFIVPPVDPHLAVQDPRGVDRPFDRGDEDLDALADEISRLDELSTVRSERPVREVLQSPWASGDPTSDGEAIRPGVDARSYPEWDYRRSAYRDPGIVLREMPVTRSDPAWVSRALERQRPLIASLRRQFLALRPRLERLRRQIEGDEIDIDAWAGEYADRLAGQAPPGLVYRAPRRRRRDLAVALLVDASGSADAWVSRDARVIDVAKEAALVLSEALCAVGDRHAIYAFSGRGPGDVRVWVAKSFGQPAGAAARARIGALEPDHATRLGGPVRHVTAALARVPAQTRILLVLSDGKPNDDDLYEGEYGVEDVRQAVHEAAAAGVRSFCVTIDRTGSSYLPRLFGSSGYTLLWDASQLPNRLPQIYRHLTRGSSA
jgi:nitric oxide reductase NorD protein